MHDRVCAQTAEEEDKVLKQIETVPDGQRKDFNANTLKTYARKIVEFQDVSLLLTLK